MLLEQLSIHAFINNNAIKTEGGHLLDFKKHRYLFDIYRDNSKYLCCIKAGQIGFSTMAILKTIWLSAYRKLNIAYILPTLEMVQKFVGSKVNPIAHQNPVVGSLMKDKDSITLKQVGQHFIHYLGAQSATSAIMLSADMLILDEYDKAPQQILETFDSRLQHSEHGYKWIFSNPTIPDFGVDRFWQISDKKMWHIKHSCNETYVLDEQCIDYKLEKYICPHCKKEITDEERRMGEWIATAKGEWSGYWIPLWVNPMVPASKIAEHKRTKSKDYFASFVAGVPYVNPNDALSQKALTKCLSDEVNPQEGRAIIGLDTGHNLHYTVLNKKGVFFHGYCPSIEENPTPGYDPYDKIDYLLTKNRNWVLIADQGGDLIGIRKLQNKHKGRVFLCWSNKETRSPQLIKWGENDEYGKVLIDRNRTMQLIVDQINDGRVVFNGSVEDWQPFFNHSLNIYRVKEITGDENDPQYGWRWVWKRKGPDHWFMSFVYAMVGLDRFKEDLAEIIKKPAIIASGTDQNGFITGRRLGIPLDI